MGTTLHEFIDTQYGPDGDVLLKQRLVEGADPDVRVGGETLLHVAARRRRSNAVAILIEHDADLDAENDYGKTAYAHALRRGFDEVAAILAEAGANRALNEADHLALAVTRGQLAEAKRLIEAHPGCVRTGNPEEDRLLADVAGRNAIEPVTLLIEAGADLSAPGLDDGTPLHQAAWFGQPANARVLVDAGAPLDVFDSVHSSSPLGWAVHGSRYSGGADERQNVYVELVRLLLDAGSSLHYPDDPGGAYLKRLRTDATEQVKEWLPDDTNHPFG